MAASEESCDGNPNFAVICSFINKFGDDCGVNISIPYLQQMLEDTKNVNEDLQELLIHLLRRGRKRVNKERWEKCLIKFCHEYSSVDAWEIERFGFTKAKLSVKLEILKRLLELQFDANAKFKAEVNKLEASSLRLLPIGRDIDGQAYWYQLDKEYNIRLYRETIGEDGAWQLLCSNTEDIRNLLASLEKKYSGSTKDSCEDKSNDSNNPKSPTSDMLPVPKKERDNEDLTSHLSESKPCTIIIKTEKREAVSHSEVPNCVKNENCAIETDKKAIGCELENSTKGSVKLKLKLEPSVHSRTEHKLSDRSVVECSAVVEKAAVVVLDAEPMEVETSKVASSDGDVQPKSVPVNDVEMIVDENVSSDKVRSESKREEQSDQNFSTNNNPSVVIEHSDPVNHHRSSKIRLYEKWSSEKKKLDTSKHSVEECNIDSKTSSVVEEKDQSFSVTLNQKTDPAIPLNCPSEQSSSSELINKQTDLAEHGKSTELETAVDLSKASRVNVIVQNMCSKPVLSNGVSSVLKSNSEKSEKDSVINTNSSNLETNKKSDASSSVSFEKSQESIFERKYKSFESEPKEAHKRKQSYSDCYDASVITKTSSVPGFSHLQALQNMCESNQMGGIPSVIQSTNRHNIENNRTAFFENKITLNCDNRKYEFENLSRKYNFNDVHCSSNKIEPCGSEATNMMLKSNVHKREDERDKKMEFKSGHYPGKNQSINFNITNEQEAFQEAPTDLSCSDPKKSDNYDSKSSENLYKTSSSAINKRDTWPTKDNIRMDVTEKEKIKLPEKASDLSRKSDVHAINRGDNKGSKSVNLCKSSEESSLLDSSVKDKESPKEVMHMRALCYEKTVANTSESAIKSYKTGNFVTDVSYKHADSGKLQKGFVKDLSVVESAKKHSKKSELNDISESVSKSIQLSATPYKCKEEIPVSIKEQTNSPNSVLKESEDEQLNKRKEPVDGKSKFVNDTSLMLEKANFVKASSETNEKSDKKEKDVLTVKPSVVAESRALKDTNDVRKEQEVITDKLLSKSFESSNLEENKPSEKTISEAGDTMCSNETLYLDEIKMSKSSKELDLTVSKVIVNKSSHADSSNVSNTVRASALCTSSGKTPKDDVENESEKENNRTTENEIDVDKASEGKMDVTKISESKIELVKASDCESTVEKASEIKMDIENIPENKLNAEGVLEKSKDVKRIPENEIDMKQISKSESTLENASENKIDTEKLSEIEMELDKEVESNKQEKIDEGKEDSKKVSESNNDIEKVIESKRSVKKVSEDKKHPENVPENEVDVENMLERKKDAINITKNEMDRLQVSENEEGTRSTSEIEKNVEVISDNKKNIEVVLKKDMDTDVIYEKGENKDVSKQGDSEVSEEKILEVSEEKILEVSEKEKYSEVSKQEKNSEISEQEKKAEVFEQEKSIEVSEQEKNTEISKQVKNTEVAKQEKNTEVSKQDKYTVSKQVKNTEISKQVKNTEVSKQVKNTEVSKQNKNTEVSDQEKKIVEKASEREEIAEKAFDQGEVAEKISELLKNVENASKEEKKVEEVLNKEKKVDEVPNKEKNVETLSENVKAGEKISVKKENVEKVANKKKDVEKLTKKERGGEKLCKKETDRVKEKSNVEKMSKKENDLEGKFKNEKDNEKVYGSETDFEKTAENQIGAEKVSKKQKETEKESENQSNVKETSENRKHESVVCDIAMDSETITKNEKCIEKVSEKEYTNTAQQNKSKLCEEINKSDHKICSAEENEVDSKSDKNNKSFISLSDTTNEEKSSEKEYDDKNEKPSPKDTLVKLKSESSKKIKEKSMEIEADFSEKNDELCPSNIESEGKLCKKDDNKSEVVTEINLKEPQNSYISDESKCLENKTEEKNESSKIQDVEMSDICPSKASCELSDDMKVETCKKSDAEDATLKEVKEGNVSKPKKTKGRSGRKTSFTRRKTRSKKSFCLQVPDVKTNNETIQSMKVEGESGELTVATSIEESSVFNWKATDGSDVLKSNVSYEEQFKVYNLRHSTCLEAKFKHPFCDKYLRKIRDLKNSHVLSECTIELTNDENLLANFNDVSPANTKTRSRGKNSKQKSESVSIPVAKPVPPTKKTPASNAKKKQNRNRKKEDPEKDDFAIPEGFLEILGNAEKTASDKGAPGKKRKGFEMKDTSASQQNSENESTPIKRSRRIQEQHQKKMTELAVEMEREQRILEQLAKRSNNAKRNVKSGSQKATPKANVKGSNAKMNVKGSGTPTKSPKARAKIQALAAEEETCMESRRATRKMNSRSKNLTKMTLLYEDESKDSQFSTSRETEKSKRRRRGRGQKKGFRPWDVSSESESSIEELTEEEEEEPEEPLIFDVNEDEFACEEVDPNAEPVVIRRARTAKKTEVADTAEECINDDTPCQKCGKYDKPEWILLCDKCDSGYHTHCLIPPLMIVPDGDWFCQPCEHMFLCQCLQEELNKLEVVLKQREREELRKQRLAYVGISLDNVLKPEKKEKSDESEKEDEEEEEEEKEEDHKPQKVKQSVDDERHQKLYGKRSVRARRNVNYQFKEYDALIASALQEEMLEMPEEEFKEEDDGSEAGSDKPFTAKISKRKKRGRRWKDLDFSDEEEDSEDDYQGGSTDSEATMPPSSNSEQESGSGEWKITKSKKKSQRKPLKSRRKRRGGDSSEEDWEDEIAESEAYRPTTRRAAQKAISYRELSSEEEDEWGAKSKEGAKKRRKAASSSESEASFKRKPSKKKRICKWASSDSSESEEEKSMSSSEGESEEDGSQDEDSENEWKIDQKEKILRLKSNTNKKVLSSEDEESSTRDSAPKKQTKKVISDESEEEDEEDDDDESESEENSDESEEDDEEENKEKKILKKPVVPEKKVPPAPTDKITPLNNSKTDSEKKGIPNEKTESVSEKKSSTDKHESLSITENREFQPKVLVKKELCSVDIPLEPLKQTVPVTSVVDKAPPKTVRKETTKMVPCVIPYDKSPKSGHTSNPEEESDKETSKEEEMPHRVPPPRPAHFPKQGTTFTSPSSRIQFGGVLARHTVPPLSSAVRPPGPPSNVPPRMLAPTNLSIRPSTSPSVVVRHTASPSNLSARPSIPPSNVPVSPSTSSTALAAKNVHTKSENKSYKSTIMEPFSNMDEENDSDDEVPLERIPNACVPAPLPNRPVSYEKEAEYRPAAKELSSYSYAPPEEKPFPGSYSPLAPFQDFSARPSPLKPSLVETYPNNSSPSKLTPLDTYSQTSSPKGFISLDSYSENRKKKHFYGNTPSEAEPPHRPPPSSSENYQGGEIRFPPEPYPCPQSPNTYTNRSPSPTQRDPGTPPRLYSQFPDAYAPPRSPEYYQNHQYYASEERIPRPSYQPNYAPPEPSFVSNPYVATPVPQPNGGFMIDTLLRARNHENEEDELTGVTDIVSYITQE